LRIADISRNQQIQLAILSERAFHLLYTFIIPATLLVITGELGSFYDTNSLLKGDLAIKAGLLLFTMVFILATIITIFMVSRRIQFKQRCHQIEILWIALSLLPLCFRFSYSLLYRFSSSFMPSRAPVYVIVRALLVIYMEVAVVTFQLIIGGADEEIDLLSVEDCHPMRNEMEQASIIEAEKD
jgi:hypothetical protein